MFELQIKPCAESEAEIVSELLEAFGALSITMVDGADTPILEPAPGETPLWDNLVLQAHFTTEAEAHEAWQVVSRNHPNLQHALSELPEQDWVRSSIADVKPKQFGENLWVCPSWLEPPDGAKTYILLDPGLAFGTGTHPTTSLCLKWLGSHDVSGQSVIDFGCGSGILALAALKLGANKAFAVDIDEQALIATKDNAEKNSIALDKLVCEKPEALSQPADLMLANILLTPLLDLKEKLVTLSKGTLLLSGILRTQAQEVIDAYVELGLRHINTAYEDEWALVELSMDQQK